MAKPFNFAYSGTDADCGDSPDDYILLLDLPLIEFRPQLTAGGSRKTELPTGIDLECTLGSAPLEFAPAGKTATASCFLTGSSLRAAKGCTRPRRRHHTRCIPRAMSIFWIIRAGRSGNFCRVFQDGPH